MRSIPGDTAYGESLIHGDFGELARRLESMNESLTPLADNVRAVTTVVTALGLGETAGASAELSEARVKAEHLLDQAAGILENLVAITTTDDTTDKSESGTPTINPLIPVELRRHTEPSKMREELGQRVFALTSCDDIPEVLALSPDVPVVRVQNDGTSLLVTRGEAEGETTATLSPTVIRGINIYIHVQRTGLEEFKKGDVNTIFGPNGGFANMDVIEKTNSAVRKSLRLPRMFTDNNRDRGARRYRIDKPILFIDELAQLSRS